MVEDYVLNWNFAGLTFGEDYFISSLSICIKEVTKFYMVIPLLRHWLKTFRQGLKQKSL